MGWSLGLDANILFVDSNSDGELKRDLEIQIPIVHSGGCVEMEKFDRSLVQSVVNLGAYLKNATGQTQRPPAKVA